MEALKDASTVQPAQTSGKNLLLFVISTFWLAKPICKPGSATAKSATSTSRRVVSD
jgi:hypothetical protein